MDTEQTITEIQQLEHMFSLADGRPLQKSDVHAANERHDEKNQHNPWFRLWKRYGI